MDSTNSEPVNTSSRSVLQISSRELPHNIEAEQALLGALLINNSVLERIEGIVAAHDFFDALHRSIWEEATQVIARGQTADPILLGRVFEQAPPITATLTVPQYLGRLVAAATTLVHAADYARLIHDLAVRRELIVLADAITEEAHAAPPEVTGEMQIERAEQQLAALAEGGRSEAEAVTFAEVMRRTIDYANAAYERNGALAGLSTGLIDLDNKLGGLAPTDLIILAGRPSMGKTALATNIAKHNAYRWLHSGGEEGAPVLFFSMEMSDEQLGMRILGEHAEISSERIRRGTFKENDFRRLVQAETEMRDMPLYTHDEGGMTLARLAARARREKRRRGIKLIIVDYLQLMAGSIQARGQNRTQEVTEITVGLKALAKELGVPIIALSQLSRAVEQRADKRPQLSDLRESGSIEQDADVVLFVFREEYYLERERPPAGDLDAQAIWDARMRETAGKAEVIIGKQRHGPVGIVPTAFNGALTQFANLAREGL